MWVNLGSGDYYVDGGWTNVDSEQSPHPVDVRFDLGSGLPLPFEGVTRAYLGHVLEHLTIPQGVRLLHDLLLVSKPGCELMIVGPDVLRATAMNQRGELSDDWLRMVREGADRWPGDQHLWECEPKTLIRMCVEAEWGNIREIPIELVPEVWPLVSQVGWQCAVQGMA